MGEYEQVNEQIDVSFAMRKYGGGFVKCLGEALIRADPNNRQRIKDAFPEYWDKYLKLAKIAKERGD